MNFDTVKYLLRKPERIFSAMSSIGLLNWIPDEAYIKMQFRMAVGYWPNLKKPVTFNEKLQWLKLHDRDPLYTTLADKYAVRQYIAKEIGEEYLIPLVGGPWSSADEIDFDALPEQFVLKCNHDSGGVIVCKNKSELNVEKIKSFLNKRLKVNFYYSHREWQYKGIKPCIIAEKYMEAPGGELRDYKFYCFDGEPKFIRVIKESAMKDQPISYAFFDMDFNMLPFYTSVPHSDVPISKPENFELMKKLAERLSRGMSHVRIDLYDTGSKVYFGEITLYDGSGMVIYDPAEWDEKIGGWLKLPTGD